MGILTFSFLADPKGLFRRPNLAEGLILFLIAPRKKPFECGLPLPLEQRALSFAICRSAQRVSAKFEMAGFEAESD